MLWQLLPHPAVQTSESTQGQCRKDAIIGPRLLILDDLNMCAMDKASDRARQRDRVCLSLCKRREASKSKGLPAAQGEHVAVLPVAVACGLCRRSLAATWAHSCA